MTGSGTRGKYMGMVVLQRRKQKRPMKAFGKTDPFVMNFPKGTIFHLIFLEVLKACQSVFQ